MNLEDLRIYNQAIDIGEEVWEVVIQWNYFAKDTRNFLYYSRGSLNETKTWLLKAYKRKLIDEAQYNSFNNKLQDLGIKLNNYINTIGKP